MLHPKRFLPEQLLDIAARNPFTLKEPRGSLREETEGLKPLFTLPVPARKPKGTDGMSKGKLYNMPWRKPPGFAAIRGGVLKQGERGYWEAR